MKPLALTAALLLSLTTSTFAANLLVNGGFENPSRLMDRLSLDHGKGLVAGPAVHPVTARSFPALAPQSLGLSINNTVNTFAGAFQDVSGLAPGMSFSLDGWHATTSSPLSLGVEIRIEWRNSVTDTEITRTPNSTPIPTASYTAFNLSGFVPAGVDTARVVYAIQSFSTAPLGNGTVYVDDMSFTAVPEPATATLLGLGVLALIGSRRRRA